MKTSEKKDMLRAIHGLIKAYDMPPLKANLEVLDLISLHRMKEWVETVAAAWKSAG